MTMKFTPHFWLPELASHDGVPVPEKYWKNAMAICERAEVLRAEVGPLFVTSGYRTAAHNRAVGGATKSMHLTASALDLTSRRYSGPELVAIYERLIKAGKVPNGGLGRYPSWVHIDFGRARRWSTKEKP